MLLESWLKWFDSIFDRLEDDRRLRWICIITISTLAAVLRFYQLGEWSFWGDEIITVNRALDIDFAGAGRLSVSLLLTYLAMATFGVGEWSARLAPALAGIVTVPVLFFLTRRLFNAGTALVAASLLAVSPWHLYWSQNARFYAFMLLFYTVALVLFYLGLEQDRPVYLLLALGFLGLAALERLVALIFLPVIGLYVLLLFVGPFGLSKGLNGRNLAVFTLPGLVPGMYLVLTFPAVRDPSLWSQLFGWVNTNPFWILSGVAYYVGVATICAATAAGVYLVLHRNRAGALLALGAVVPLLLIAAVSTFQYAANRYVFVSLTSWLILAGVAVRELFRESSPGGPRLLAAGLLMILVFTAASEDALYYLYQHGNRDNWKAAFEFIGEEKAPDDLVVSANPALGQYYLGEEVLGMANLDVQQIGDEGHRVWIVEDMTASVKWPRARQRLISRGELIREFDVRVRARNFEMNVYLIDNAISPSE